jgi:hypothetical protein
VVTNAHARHAYHAGDAWRAGVVRVHRAHLRGAAGASRRAFPPPTFSDQIFGNTPKTVRSLLFSSCCCLRGNDTEKNLPFPFLHSRQGELTVGRADLTDAVQAVVCQAGALLSFTWKFAQRKE